MFCSHKKTQSGSHLRWSAFACLLMCISVLFLSGCPIGAVFALFAKKDPLIWVEPEYEFSAGQLLILVDSPPERTGLSGIRPLLTRQLVRQIELHSLPPAVIPPEDLAALRISTDDFSQLSITEVGQRLCADQVLYVEVLEFRLGTFVDKPAGQGMARVRASVFNVSPASRAWPKDKPLGYEVLVHTPFREPTGQDFRQEFAEDICARAAESVVKLFRRHEEPRRQTEE